MDIIMTVSFVVIALALVALVVISLVGIVVSLKMAGKAFKEYNKILKKFEPYIDKMVEAMEEQL